MPTQPALSSAVERLTAAPDASQSPDAEPEGFEERLGAWAERTLTQLPLIVTPRRDLALIGWSSRTFYGKKAKAALSEEAAVGGLQMKLDDLAKGDA